MSRWFVGFTVAMSLGVAIAVMRIPASADGFWLANLWGTWLVCVVWALTRPSFSVLFAAITM